MKKEVYDLLVSLWPQLGEEDRDALVRHISAGPPASLSDHLPPGEREQLRARRIFERLRIMERSDAERQNTLMTDELHRLRERFPHWDVAPGEMAHFSTFSHFGMRVIGPPDEDRRLEEMTVAQIIDRLMSDHRESALEDWQEMVASDWEKMLGVLRGVTERRGTDPELWAATLWGLRTKAAAYSPGESVLSLVAEIDAMVIGAPGVSAAAAYLLESASSSAQFSEMAEDEFWRAFDVVAAGVFLDDDNSRAPRDLDWVGLSINTSMGNLTRAFLNALFARRLVVGGGIPADLTGRFVRLIGDGQERHRPARVIFASRLSYLYAVDPDFVRSHFLPYFKWQRDETEALAVWQGFGWEPHIDPLLWAEIKVDLLACFQERRLERLGVTAHSLAQIIAAAGLHFGLDELPRHATQEAFRQLDPESRASVLSWIAGSMVRAEENQDPDPDAAWTNKVKPWILKFWPRTPQIRSSTETRPWVELALATDRCFDDAVATVASFIVPEDDDYLVSKLLQSHHPTTHPHAALRLLDAFLSPNVHMWFVEELRRLLDCLVAADPAVRQDPAFIRWDIFARARI